MIVFSILRVPMTEWNIHRHSQELFDAVFNYFPITFRPPPNDPYGITAQDLKQRLRDCIAASAELAPYAFPALLDKLDSSSLNTKRDVLDTITACVENYGPQTVSLYSVTLWDALKFEILQVQEDDLAQLALGALSSIAQSLSGGSGGALTAFLKPIAKEANEHLEDAPTKQSQATERILERVAAASPASCNYLIGTVLPQVFALYGSADSVAKRRGLIEVMDGLIRADVTVFGEWRSIEGQSETAQTHNGLRDQHAQTLELLVNALSHTPQKEVSFRLTALRALTNLLKARSVLGTQDLTRTISVLDDIVLNEEPHGNDDVKTASMSSLVTAAQQKPQLVIDTAFPKFLAKLPDTDPQPSTRYLFTLEAFAQLATEPQVFPTVVLRLRHKLNAALHQRASATFIQSILVAILYAFSQNASSLQATSESIPYYDDIILPLIQQAVAAGGDTQSAFMDEGVLELVGRLANIIMRAQTTHYQNKGNDPLFVLFQSLGGQTSQTDAAGGEQLLISATYVFAAVRKDAALPQPIPEMLAALKSHAQREDLSPRVRVACVQQMALLLNKHVSTGELSPLLDSAIDPQALLQHENSYDMRIAFAVTKAILLRNASVLPGLLRTILAALASPSHGLTIANGFNTLLQPDDILCRENHCIISALHKQKLFNLVITDISASYRTADPVLQRNYLVALAGILRYLQYTIVEPHLATLTPLILQMLDLVGVVDVKASALTTLIAVLTHQPQPLEEHTSSLITRLLACTMVSAAPSNVRVKALKAMGLVARKLDRAKVIPFRRQVVKRLTAALDDKKRDVRSEAVRCRSVWIEMDEAGDEDD